MENVLTLIPAVDDVIERPKDWIRSWNLSMLGKSPVCVFLPPFLRERSLPRFGLAIFAVGL
jgi:hypothetical protein